MYETNPSQSMGHSLAIRVPQTSPGGVGGALLLSRGVHSTEGRHCSAQGHCIAQGARAGPPPAISLASTASSLGASTLLSASACNEAPILRLYLKPVVFLGPTAAPSAALPRSDVRFVSIAPSAGREAGGLK